MAASSSRITLDLLKKTASRPSALAKRSQSAISGSSGRAAASHFTLPPRRHLHGTASAQAASTGKGKGKSKGEEPRYNFNTSLFFTEDPDPDHVNYRRVTATELRYRKEPPTKVKMLVRDFIDDSLYNPHYGYFSKNATIFAPPDGGYDFSKFKNQVEFEETVAAQYVEKYGQNVDDPAGGGAQKGGSGRQVWHTPTELFKPYYAQSLISAILQSHAQTPEEPLIIYELGAGNGSFMLDSLRYIRKNHPDIFARTTYRIIEISAQLAKRQRSRAKAAGLEGVVEVVESDFFKWQGGGEERCYVVALEVLDNFAHDMIRYDLKTLDPLQAVVVIDAQNEFTLLYERLSDPLLRRYLYLRGGRETGGSSTRPNISRLLNSPLMRQMFTSLPFAPNLSKPDFIPSKAMLFLERLRERLPNHRLLVADFEDLPDTVPGRNGPVVQTRVGQEMVPCETFLVKQGYFDIFFPTDFKMLRDMYTYIMRQRPSHTLKSPNPQISSSSDAAAGESESASSTDESLAKDTPPRPEVRIYGQDEFMRTYGGEPVLRKLTTKDGVCVVDRMYGNARVMF